MANRTVGKICIEIWAISFRVLVVEMAASRKYRRKLRQVCKQNVYTNWAHKVGIQSGNITLEYQVRMQIQIQSRHTKLYKVAIQSVYTQREQNGDKLTIWPHHLTGSNTCNIFSHNSIL